MRLGDPRPRVFLKHLQNPCSSVKLLSGFLHTQFICLFKPLKSATFGFFASFLLALCTMWPNIIPHVLFFCHFPGASPKQTLALHAKEGDFLGRTSSPKTPRITYADFVLFSQRQYIFLKKTNPTNPNKTAL